MKSVALIGYGRFGRALAELCAEHELSVRAFDARATAVPDPIRAPSLSAAVAGAELVVLAVPVPAMKPALEQLAPHLTEAQLLIDVGSVKSGPVAAMRAVLGKRIPWAATHPLFGPTSLALGERPLRVIVCPNPIHATAATRARKFWEQIGGEVIEQDAEDHDRAMADTHALAFFVAKGLLDAHAGEGVPYAPPSFQAIARTIEAVRSDAGHLFLAIHRENPYAGAARRRLLDALQNVDDELARSAATSEPAASSTEGPLAIPDLGTASPDLMETRELIDEVDRELCDLLARRAALSVRAGRAKKVQGQAVRDDERERAVLAERARWAKERELDADSVRDVFEAILRFSRGVQRS